VDLRVFATGEEMAHAAARRVADALRQRPTLVLGLPAGRTPIGVYTELVRLAVNGQIDFSRATAFALDEFVGLDGMHPASFQRFLREHLVERVNLARERFHALNGMATDLIAECDRYEDTLQRAGGIGLQLLGIGGNGHIGFNEPATELIGPTHPVTLHEALTMGVGSILKAEAVILLATGESKATSVQRMARGPMTPQLPASFLQAHRSVEIYLDRAAASRL
jgi:glucosamine-6-phosphate deaminase